MSDQHFHFHNIADFCEFMGGNKPENPHLFVKFQDEQVSNVACQVGCMGEVSYSTDFYMIAVKNIIAGDVYYGRTKYDFSNGSMMFLAPRQRLKMSNVVISSHMGMILVHEDYLQGHKMRDVFKNAGFFSYAVNEALHLSPREESQIRMLMHGINDEYQNNQDEYSKDLILSQLDTLLKYAKRYYSRQFLNRKELSNEILVSFEQVLAELFEPTSSSQVAVPKIDDIASRMGISSRYLSDTLKSVTGMAAQEHIHLYLLDEAKNLLLQPNISVSQVAYQLGFEYPQYFSRLFKKKVGVSPKVYQSQSAIH
ncbi:helix-turn-helix domain-containing protein [Sneathiella sp. P13V-1]|uniref:helix-turn-helix domain-containing protein n=1 Tax=Sneathiella sp. P13V-1 TaxID=2697366 RepID=UPI00187B6E3C|nr:response regulator transcription factor [Sneathiella sp. P13V-1]MBE7638259.1 helix-turn-helix domain-containing protein [Sneathiella sp. P13V-1]